MKKIYIVLITSCLLLSMFFSSTRQIDLDFKQSNQLENTININTKKNSYFLDKKIPNIVEGTAKIFDTDSYFDEHSLENYYAKANIVNNNISNLKISIGYKPPSYDLF